MESAEQEKGKQNQAQAGDQDNMAAESELRFCFALHGSLTKSKMFFPSSSFSCLANRHFVLAETRSSWLHRRQVREKLMLYAFYSNLSHIKSTPVFVTAVHKINFLKFGSCLLENKIGVYLKIWQHSCFGIVRYI